MDRKTFLLSLAGLPAAAAEYERRVSLPAPFATPSASNRSQVVPRPDGARLTVPDGFAIDEFAAGFQRPRAMIQDSPATFLLADSVGPGSIVRMSLDGKQRGSVLTGLNRPYGMALRDGYLYVGETTSVKRCPYDATTGRAGGGQEVFNMEDYGRGHWTRDVEFDSQGKLYVSIGSQSNVNTGEPKDRAAILRMNADGSGREHFAEGLRNPVSIHFYPNTDTLWTVVQERDALGDDLVPDYFTSVKQGAFYGWPYAYIGPNEDPRREGESPEMVKKAIAPDYPLAAHVGVIDFLFYSGSAFPEKYRGGAFVSFHGSWNRSKRTGQTIMFIPFEDAKPGGDPETFVSGWMLSPDRNEVWGRPTGLFQMPDGSILISDDGGNRIWRVSYRG